MIRFICEIGSNHCQDLDRCFELIRVAKELGANDVKFQLFKAKSLWSEFEKQKEMEKWELPINFIPHIAEYCKEQEIKLGFSVFYLDAVKALEPYVDWFKIGSFEILWLDLIKAVAETGLPVILSTGMGTGQEIWQALKPFDDYHGGLYIPIPSILHCQSTYPALPESCDLSRIDWLRKKFRWYYEDLKIGWSDHTRHPGVIYAAIAQGAEVIELHLDLDGQGWEYQVGHCWLPGEIKNVIDNVRIGEMACQPSEQDLSELRQQRTDTDGMRPIKEVRK